MEVWLNGQFVSADSARVSVFDAGFQHGVGLFETMLARNGRVFRVHEHLERLSTSAASLLLSESLHLGPLAEAIQQAVTHAGLDDARVRLTITGGDLNMLQARDPSAAQDPTILIVAQPPTQYPDQFFEDGIRVMIADARVSPLDPMAGHKTLNYWPRIHSLQQATARGAGEALWFTVSNHLTGGAVSNIFLVRNDTLITPIARGEEEQDALPSAVLPGITRQTITELAAEATLATERRLIDIEDLLGADEVFLTNSSWGVLPVVGVERETIASGQVGPITAQLRANWLARVHAGRD